MRFSFEVFVLVFVEGSLAPACGCTAAAMSWLTLVVARCARAGFGSSSVRRLFHTRSSSHIRLRGSCCRWCVRRAFPIPEFASRPSMRPAVPASTSRRLPASLGTRIRSGSMRCSADSSASGGQRKPKRKPSTKTKNQNENLKRKPFSFSLLVLVCRSRAGAQQPRVPLTPGAAASYLRVVARWQNICALAS